MFSWIGRNSLGTNICSVARLHSHQLSLVRRSRFPVSLFRWRTRLSDNSNSRLRYYCWIAVWIYFQIHPSVTSTFSFSCSWKPLIPPSKFFLWIWFKSGAQFLANNPFLPPPAIVCYLKGLTTCMSCSVCFRRHMFFRRFCQPRTSDGLLLTCEPVTSEAAKQEGKCIPYLGAEGREFYWLSA